MSERRIEIVSCTQCPYLFGFASKGYSCQDRHVHIKTFDPDENDCRLNIVNKDNTSCICDDCRVEPLDNCPKTWNGADEKTSKYNELLMCVQNKYPGESRHQTAKRLIKEAQESNNLPKELSGNTDIKP